jgi:hypothetical protein
MNGEFSRVLSLAGACALFAALAATACAQTQGSWTMKAPIPLARNEVALAAVGGKVHVIGGGIKGVAGTYHDEYDPATDRWRTRAPLPFGLDHIGTAVLNGKIYAIGGFVGSVHKDGQPHVLQYDPAADKWRSLIPLKSGLGSVAVAVLDGKIHAVGGRNPEGQTVSTHQVYDPASDDWSERAPLPKARDHMALVTAEGKLHAIGGRFGASRDKTDMHDIYENKFVESGSAAPDCAERPRLHTLSKPDPGDRRRSAARHVCRKRGVRSENRKLEVARANARRPSWDRRGSHWRQCLCRSRIIEAGVRRGYGSAHRLYNAMNVTRGLGAQCGPIAQFVQVRRSIAYFSPSVSSRADQRPNANDAKEKFLDRDLVSSPNLAETAREQQVKGYAAEA